MQSEKLAMGIERITVSEPMIRVGCTLGESPIYDADTDMLHFVDIEERKVYHLDTTTKELSEEQFPEKITCLTLRKHGPGLACATASGVAVIEDSQLRYICRPIAEAHRTLTRLNDGACDSRGRFFVGSLYNKKEGIPGMLYRVNPSDGTCLIVDDGPFTDSNGLGWSPDETTLYFTDSHANIIYAYDYDVSKGRASNRRVFIDAMAAGLKQNSFCDGLCIDTDGCIWGARWGGSCISRFTREGKVNLLVEFPTVLRVTACTFGGPDMDKLYVTTAHCGAGSGDQEGLQDRFPDSGHLFEVDFNGRFKGAQWRYPMDI